VVSDMESRLRDCRLGTDMGYSITSDGIRRLDSILAPTWQPYLELSVVDAFLARFPWSCWAFHFPRSHEPHGQRDVDSDEMRMASMDASRIGPRYSILNGLNVISVTHKPELNYKIQFEPGTSSSPNHAATFETAKIPSHSLGGGTGRDSDRLIMDCVDWIGAR
jgi:hypothetical protein